MARPRRRPIWCWRSARARCLIPDILCNSGGVVVSYFEWVQDLQQLFWEEEEVTRREYAILDRAFDTMVTRANADKIPHRTAAMAIGVEKVRRQEHARAVPVITGLDHVVVLTGDINAASPPIKPCLPARRPGRTAAVAPTASCSRSTTRRWN